MKISMQEKIAELERRIIALEGQQKRTTTTTKTTVTNTALDLEPEMGGVWTAFDALFAKVFK